MESVFFEVVVSADFFEGFEAAIAKDGKGQRSIFFEIELRTEVFGDRAWLDGDADELDARLFKVRSGLGEGLHLLDAVPALVTEVDHEERGLL